jgi:ferredoxin
MSLNRSKCAGHALCYTVAPELFPLDDEGYSILQPRVVAESDEQRARDGVAACPEGALSLDEDPAAPAR